MEPALDTRQRRWNRLSEWPLLVASFAFLAAYSWQVIGNLKGSADAIADAVINATWLVFAVDYAVNLWLAPSRWNWFRRHLLDLLVVALPLLRPLRAIRLVTVVQQFQRHAGPVIRGRVIIYTATTTLLLVYVAALAVLDAERDEGSITNLGDALWWAFVTITTVGYGDLAPTTVTGRLVAGGLMLGGITLIGVVTATLASWIVERVSEEQAESSASKADILELQAELRALRDRLGESPSTGSDDHASDPPRG